jgi:hypothetical protein
MDAIQEAQRLYQDSLDATAQQRRQIAEDLEFSDPSDPQQWDKDLKRERENDPGGVRPCLVFDQTGQYVANVAGQIEKMPPSLHAIPVGGGADKRAAENLDGFFRHIEHSSRASQHYIRAETSAARAGVGYIIVRPEYVNRALNYQEPRIGSEGDPLRVVFDPWSQELDGSDATFGFLLTPLSHREFERQFGKGKKKVSFADAEQRLSTDERESIIVVESWKVVDRTQNMILCTGPDGDEMALSEDDFHKAMQRMGGQLQVTGTYSDKVSSVKWCRMSGAEYLTEETEYPASSIGLVPVYGYVGYQDGRLRYCGIPRRARSGQQAYNFHMSEMEVLMSQAAKAPYLIPISGLGDGSIKDLWDNASVQSRAYLPYVDRDEQGNPVNAPIRLQPAINLQNHIQGAQQAIHDIQASLGMYQASLGAPSNESSGVAIEQRKQQGEAATSHFPGNLSASLGQVGKIVMEMIPRLIDTKRQARILSFDGASSQVTIDPGQSQSVVETETGLSINPNVGKYDMRVVVGASFSTQRSQTQAALSEVMRGNPQLTPAIAPIWAGTLDIQNADKLAQVLAAMAPPEVRAILNPEADKTPKLADVMAELSQVKAALQEAVQHAHDAQQDADQAEQKAADKTEADQVAWYKAETDRLKVTGANEAQIQAIVQDMVNQMLSGPDPLPGDPEPGPEAWQAQPLPMEGTGMDEQPMHEQAESPQFERQEEYPQ